MITNYINRSISTLAMIGKNVIEEFWITYLLISFNFHFTQMALRRSIT